MNRMQPRPTIAHSRRTVLIRRRLTRPRPLTPLYPILGGTMQPEDDARLGTPPDARAPHEGDKPPRMGLGLMLGLILGCAAVAAVLLWLYGNVPQSG